MRTVMHKKEENKREWRRDGWGMKMKFYGHLRKFLTLLHSYKTPFKKSAARKEVVHTYCVLCSIVTYFTV